MVVFKGMIRGMAWRLFDSGHPEYFTVQRCNTTQTDPEASDFCKSVDKDDSNIVPGNREAITHNISNLCNFSHLQNLFLMNFLTSWVLHSGSYISFFL